MPRLIETLKVVGVIVFIIAAALLAQHLDERSEREAASLARSM
ncbi:hypothetical protein [Cupriavidus sp. UYPR2.512]|nr:hypothetical protein [Cupriavidus sp. UYPR2.512]